MTDCGDVHCKSIGHALNLPILAGPEDEEFIATESFVDETGLLLPADQQKAASELSGSIEK